MTKSVIPIHTTHLTRTGKNFQRTEENTYDVLSSVAYLYARHIVARQAEIDALSLWTLYTYVYDVFDHAPLLAIVSPERRCGKSTTLGLLKLLCRKPLVASNITEAALFRLVDSERPTLLLDEGETFITDKGLAVRGILNAGHARTAAVVYRCAGTQAVPFNVFCPKAIALIGALPSTLTDRSIEIRLQRKQLNERVEKLPQGHDPELSGLKRALERWAQRSGPFLADVEPELPRGLHDRAHDNWLPLFAIAQLIGGTWPEQARRASIVLTQVSLEDETASVQLLHDVQYCMNECGVEYLTSAALIDQLCAQEDRPWRHYRNGGRISAHQVARLLSVFDIRPIQIWAAGKNLRGYRREMFTDAFSRYLDGWKR